MRTYNFTEMPYPFIPPQEELESLRVQLPNGLYDPKIGAELFNRYLDEHVACDELGLDVMVNEHHQTPTCLQSAAPLMLSALARETKRARLLILGNPLGMRRDPVRVAEEMATIDNISYGRLDCGFIRGIPYEVAAANMPAVGMYERMWEAHDLILKAFTTHDGPFNWEGRHFHYRHVNIWPRPYQQPHPPIWITASSPSSVPQIAQNGHVAATFLQGFDGSKRIYDVYREEAVRAGRFATVEDVPIDRFALMAIVYVGDTDDEGRAGADQSCWYIRTQKSAIQWTNPPGYFSADKTAEAMRILAQGKSLMSVGGGFDPKTATVDDLIHLGMVCAGNPDTVFDQITDLFKRTGGFGNLLIMTQAGAMSRSDSMASLERFARDVQPRLAELTTAT